MTIKTRMALMTEPPIPVFVASEVHIMMANIRPLGWRKFRLGLALLWIAAALALLLGRLSHASPVMETGAVSLVTGWQYRWGDPVLQGVPVSAWLVGPEADGDVWKAQETFPARAPGRDGEKNLWQRVVLPKTNLESPSLFLLGVDQAMEVYLDSDLIYRFGEFDDKAQSEFSGYPWHVISLPSEYAGKRLSFRIWADHVNIGLIGNVTLGSEGDFFRQMIRSNLNPLLVMVILCFVGIAGIAMFLAKRSNREYLFFGLFGLTSGLYILTRLGIKQVIVSDGAFWNYIELATFYLSVTTFIAMVDTIFVKTKWNILRKCWMTLAAFTVISFAGALAFGGLSFLFMTMAPFQIAVLISIVIVLVVIARRAFAGDREAIAMVVGFAIVVISTALDILVSLGVVFVALQGALVFVPWGTLSLVLCFGYILLGRFLDVYRRVLEHKRNLETLAEQGRLIGGTATFDTLCSQVKTSFDLVTHEPVEADLHFHSAVFIDRDLPEGYYSFGSDGRLNEGAVRALETVRSQEARALVVEDPRTQESLAVVPLRLVPDEKMRKALAKLPEDERRERERTIMDQVAGLLEPMTNNMASAITTIRLEQTFAVLEKRTQEIQTIFANINQGILMVDSELKVLPEYSIYLETLFGKSEIAGHPFLEFAFARSTVTGDLLSQIENCLGGSLGEDVLAWETNSDVLPHEIHLIRGDKELDLEVDWTAIVGGDDVVRRIMVTFRDVTTLKALKAAAEANRLEMEMISEIVSLAAEKFAGFVGSGRRYVDDCISLLRKPGGATPEDLNDIKRFLHTVKGNSRTLKLSFLTSLTHEVESIVIDMVNRGVSHGDLPAEELVAEISKVAARIEDYHRIATDRLGRKDAVNTDLVDAVESAQLLAKQVADAEELTAGMRSQMQTLHRRLVCLSHPTLSGVVRTLSEGLSSLADEMHRSRPSVALDSHMEWVLGTDLAEALQGSMTHMFRNSLDHGFRGVSDGVITLIPSMDGGAPRLEYSDNGRGLDLNRLESIGRNKGLISAESPSDADVAQLVFISGVSTAEKVTDVSGRGVGMDAVRSLMGRVGAKVSLQLCGERNADGFCRFSVIIEFRESDLKEVFVS